MPDSPVKYIERTRAYYLAQGFPRPYTWATHADIPFHPLKKPIAESRLGLITTAIPADAAGQARRVHVRKFQSPPEQLCTDEVSWDRQTTHTDDLNSYFPVDHLNAFVGEGKIGSHTEHFYCAPTEFSHRRTNEIDAPAILEALIEDQADIALLVPL